MFSLYVRPLGLCLAGNMPVVVGGGIWLPAVFALRSLAVVSCSVLPLVKAGSLDGGLRPDGRMFSICDTGRSILSLSNTARAGKGCRQCEVRITSRQTMLQCGP